MFNSILMVCVGNICRSITAERMLRNLYPNKRVESAGLGALVGNAADEMASTVAKENGIDLTGHSARQVTGKILRDYDLILVMEKDHLEGVTKISPEVRGKTMLLGKWIGNKDIPDPYKRSREVYDIAFDLIAESVQSWTKYLG